MGRIQTQINGITTTSVYQEGDSYSLVNLRKKNGVLHPVSQRKIVQELTQDYDIVFVHQNLSYENWIGVRNISDTKSEIYWKILDENPILIDFGEDIFRINSVQQIGNTLVLITDTTIKYLLFNGEDYIVLGEIPEMDTIHYFLESFTYTANFNALYDGKSVLAENTTEAVLGLYNYAKQKVWDETKGCLFDSHMMVFAFRLYDGSHIKHSSPILLCSPEYPGATVDISLMHPDGQYIYNLDSNVHLKYYHTHLLFDTNYLEKWKDIIIGIDVFISIGLGYNSESNFKDLMSPIDNSPIQGTGMLLLKEQTSMIQNIKDVGNFYLVSSIKIGEIGDSNNNLYEIPLKSNLNNLDILIDKESLALDTFSHNKITGDVVYTYNRRLHLANIKNTLFNGFDFGWFELYYITGKLNWYNGYNPVNYSQYQYQGIAIMVDIKINGITKTVCVKYESPIVFWINPYFSYPDSRAFKTRFYEILGENSYRLIHEIDLTPSSYLNLAYYISTESGDEKVKPPIPNNNSNTEQVEIIPQDESYAESGKLKVSSLNNPFIFPNENTYTVGNGDILALATIAPRISEGSFGQYPLYVFTTKGIYSLAIGSGTIVYSNEVAPTSYEVPTTKIVCETPFGVVFTSNRGICMITGQEVQLLTSPIQEHPKILNIQEHPNINKVILNYGETKFVEFLKGIEFILYNPFENELIITDKDSPFNYVLNFESKQIYQSTEKIDKIVENNFPKLNVIEERTLKDYSESEMPDAKISLISRPILYGTDDFKKLERMILRALLFNVNKDVNENKTHIINYFSIDGINFDILRGIPIKHGSCKDLDMGLFARSKYRQFLFAFAGIIDEKSQIQYLETEILEEYNNTKMR